MKLRKLFAYPDDFDSVQGLTKNVIRNLHLIFWSFTLLVSLSMTDEGLFTYVALNFFFLLPLTIYWTPIFQRTIFKQQTSFLKRFLVYLSIYTFIGTLLIPYLLYKAWTDDKVLENNYQEESAKKNDDSDNAKNSTKSKHLKKDIEDVKPPSNIQNHLSPDEEIKEIFKTRQIHIGDTAWILGKNYIIFTDKQAIFYTSRAIRKDIIAKKNYEDIIGIEKIGRLLLTDKLEIECTNTKITAIEPKINDIQLQRAQELLAVNTMIPDTPTHDNLLRVLAPLLKNRINKEEDIKYIYIKQKKKQYYLNIGSSKNGNLTLMIRDLDLEKTKRIVDKYTDKNLSVYESEPVIGNKKTRTTNIPLNNIEDALSLIGAFMIERDNDIHLQDISITFDTGDSVKSVKTSVIPDEGNILNKIERLWCSKPPKHLERVKENTLKEVLKPSNKDNLEKLDNKMEEYFEERKEFINRIKSKYDSEIQSFLKKHGKGDQEQLERLKDLIQRRHSETVNYDDLKMVVYDEWEQKQKDALKTKLLEYDPDDTEDYIEAFIEEVGQGNYQSQRLLSKIIDLPVITTQEKVEQKLEELREKKEQERFEKELGLDSEDRESQNTDPDILETLKQDKYRWEDVEEMDGLEFEHFLENIFSEMGYEANVTSGSNDQGADLIVEKPYEKIVVQAKRYSGKVSNSAVQEVVAAIDHYNAESGIVVTNNGFTRSAKELAESNKVELWNGDKLKDVIDKHLNKNKI